MVHLFLVILLHLADNSDDSDYEDKDGDEVRCVSFGEPWVVSDSTNQLSGV